LHTIYGIATLCVFNFLLRTLLLMASPQNKKTPFRAGFLIHDASRLRRTVFDQRLKPLGITRSQWWVLSNLDRGHDDGFSQIELARLLDIGKVTLGGLISRLEKNDLVTRVSDADDRRSKRVRLSTKGRALLDRLEVIALGVNQQIMENISAAEEQQLIETLTKMKLNLKAMDGVPLSTTGRKVNLLIDPAS
jgi:MarR family transcriptional regulator, transcriptional regulator for hemolysin